jgi:hypothetical protein
VGVNKLLLKFLWGEERPQIPNLILKKNKIGGLMPQGFQTYDKVTASRCWYAWRQDKQINKQNRNLGKCS